MKNNLEILKTLADETRLEILNMLLKEDSYIEKLACELSLTPATVCYHLKKMEGVGLVYCSRSQFYIIYSLNREIFDRPLKDFIGESQGTRVVGTDEKYKQQVLSNFFRFGRLVTIPAQKKKREIVMEEMVKVFEIGKEYSEQQVNEMIHTFHHDHCTIRREMVVLGLLNRNRDRYWVNK